MSSKYIKTDIVKCNNIEFKDSKYKNLRCLNIDKIYDINSSTETHEFVTDKLYLCNKTDGNYTKNYIYEYKTGSLPETNGIIPEDGLIIKINSNKKCYIYFTDEWMLLNIGQSDISNYYEGVYRGGVIYDNDNVNTHKYTNIFGLGNKSTNDYMTVIGKYNDNTTSNNLFVVGNGTDNNNRKNIFEVKNNGVRCNNDLRCNNLITNNDIGCGSSIYSNKFIKTYEYIDAEDYIQTNNYLQTPIIKFFTGLIFCCNHINVWLNMGDGDDCYLVIAQITIDETNNIAIVTSGTIYANRTTQATQAFAYIEFEYKSKHYILNAIQKIQENGGTICLSANNWQCTDKLTVNSLKYNGPNYGWANFHTVYPVGTWPAYQFCGSLFHIESIN